MKKATDRILKSVVKAANNSLKRDANSTTCGMIYQPKAPASLKDFKNIKNVK